MQAQQSTTETVMTSPSMVLIPREDPLPKMIFVVIALVLGVIFFVALMTLLSALMPSIRSRGKSSITNQPWRTFLFGLACYAVLGGLAWFFYSRAFIFLLLKTEIVPGMLIGGIVVSALLLLMSLVGATGTIAFVGDRLEVLAGRDISDLKKSIWGTLTLVLASWFPGVGWFLVMPGTLILSMGAGVVGWFGGRRDNKKLGKS
jgi:hypothetical protein